MLQTIRLPLLTLFRGDGFVLEYEPPEHIQSPSLHLFSSPGRGDDGVLQALTQQSVSSISNDDKFSVDMQGSGDTILPPGFYSIRVRGYSAETAMLTTLVSGSVEVIDYDETDKLSCRLAELRIVNERLVGGDHYITRLSLPDGREIYRMEHQALMDMRNQLEREISEIRRALEGRPLLRSGGRVQP